MYKSAPCSSSYLGEELEESMVHTISSIPDKVSSSAYHKLVAARAKTCPGRCILAECCKAQIVVIGIESGDFQHRWRWRHASATAGLVACDLSWSCCYKMLYLRFATSPAIAPPSSTIQAINFQLNTSTSRSDRVVIVILSILMYSEYGCTHQR